MTHTKVGLVHDTSSVRKRVLLLAMVHRDLPRHLDALQRKLELVSS